MKKLTKFLSLVTTAALIALTVAGCGSKPADINVAVLKGPTGVGMASLMDSAAAGKASNNYTFTVESAPTDIVPKLATGEVDIAAVPTNLAATLYKKTDGNIKMLAINTLGVLHILEKGESVKSVADLKGRTIYATGQGSNPEYILRYIIEKNGLDPDKDLKIEYVASNDELTAAIVSGKADLAMIAEPAATTVLAKAEGFRRALDVSAEWDKVSETPLMMGCVVVRADFLSENEDAVKAFLKEYEKSINACKDVEAVAALCEAQGIIPAAAVAKAAIPNCNITFVKGEEMKRGVGAYFKVLFDGNPASIGGELPPDALYYLG